MIFSPELRIALLIWVLYGSTCMVLLYANEGILERAFGGVRLRVAEDRLRILGRSPVGLNPLLPMFPVFRVRWGDEPPIPERADLPPAVTEALAASAILTPYVLVVFLGVVIGIPVAVLALGAARALPVLLFVYAAIALMLVRLWFLRDKFAINGGKFTLLAFECVVCPPLAAGIVRRLSLGVPLDVDMAGLIPAMPAAAAAAAVEQLVRCCSDLEAACEEGSPQQQRMMRYVAVLREYRVPEAAPADAGADARAQPAGNRIEPAARNS